MRNVIIILVVAFILMGVGFFGSATTAARKENKCWASEATRVLEKYGSLKTRDEVVRAAGVTKDRDANPIGIADGGDNDCSPGSNGKTAVRFYFDRANRLTAIQVWRNYSGTETKMIRERKFRTGQGG